MATKKFSRGDTNKDGLIFFKYYGNKEKWLSKEEFLIEKQKELERSRRPHVAERKRKRSRESYHKNKLREKERKAKFYQENKEKIKKRNSTILLSIRTTPKKSISHLNTLLMGISRSGLGIMFTQEK